MTREEMIEALQRFLDAVDLMMENWEHTDDPTVCKNCMIFDAVARRREKAVASLAALRAHDARRKGDQ